MTGTPWVGLCAGLLSMAAFIPYLRSMFQGKTRPNRATWWIWTVVGILIALSYHSSGAGHTIWVPVSYVLGPFITAIFSLKYGEGGASLLDKCCFTGTAMSVLLWLWLKSPFSTLFINLIIDFLGALPTIQKSYRRPEQENLLAWILFACANTLNLFVLKKMAVSHLIYTGYMVFCSYLILGLLLRRFWPSKVIRTHTIEKIRPGRTFGE